MRYAWLPQVDGEWGAVYSDCDRYRYRLWREWDASKPTLAFCMLNPSTATEVKNDPTIERCMRRAIAWEYGRLEIVNIFALRSTDPRALYACDDPVGPDNDTAILDCAHRSSAVICGWGAHGSLSGRGVYVRKLLLEHWPDGLVHVLRVNKDGSPCHPLYLSYNLKPQEWI